MSQLASASSRARLTADVLFVVQLVCGLAFGIGQIVKMFESTQGVSISWFVFWGLFLIINMRLSFQSHQAAPSRVTYQTRIIYVVWTSLMAVNLGVLIAHRSGQWSDIDTLTSLLALAGVTATLIVGARHQLTWRDPIVRGWLAVFFKGVPQLTLAWNMWLHGGAGLAAIGIWAGHVTICMRIGQLVYAIREAGWDRYRRGSLISEVANEASWIVATVVWVLV